MEIEIIKHPLIEHKLTILRQESTSSLVFKQLVEELVMLLAYEATRDIQVDDFEISTPVAKTIGKRIREPRPIIVPILRAGLGMLEGMQKILPCASVGFLGIKRNEETLEPITYANRLPAKLNGIHCFIVDPMLATGGTLIDSIGYLYQNGAREITCICLLGAPEGVQALKEATQEYVNCGLKLKIYLSALDQKLNEKGYIVPGLGDAGDRLYGLGE